MTVEKFSINRKRNLIQIVVTSSQKEVWDFVHKLSIPTQTDANFRESKTKEFTISFKCSSEESYKELYQSINDIIQKYI